MKLRMRGSSIRLRLVKSEVAALGNGSRVEERVTFPDGKVLAYVLAPDASGSALGARFDGGVLTVTVPASQALAWATSDEVGLEATLTAGSGELRILIEKDYECLKPRVGEDEGDAFPNPQSINEPGRDA